MSRGNGKSGLIMKKRWTHRTRRAALAGLVVLAAGLAACGGGTADGATDASAGAVGAVGAGDAALSGGASSAAGVEAGTNAPMTSTAYKASRPPAVPPSRTEGRLLASNCFQCHGTGGTGGFDSIRGSEAEEVLEYLTKPANRDIMAAHAQGYTRAQLQQIIAYLQQ